MGQFVSCKCGTPLELEEYETFSCPLCKKVYHVELTEVKIKKVKITIEEIGD